MKKIITLLFAFITFHSYAQDFSTIHFICRGSTAFTYNIYINKLLIATVKGKQTLSYKMHSEGGIYIDVQYNDFKKTSKTLEIKHGQTYYFECYGTDDSPVSTRKGKIILSETESYITGEEGKNNLLPNVPVIDNNLIRQGTCFLINRKGYLITSYHIIRNAKTIQVKGIGGDFSTLYGADVVSYDVDMDMVLLKIKNPNISFDTIPYKLSSETNPKGIKAFVPGYPLTTDKSDTLIVKEGTISAINGCLRTISQYQFSEALQPGNSGGPLFNEKGDVLGLINTNLKEVEGTSYAVKSQYIQAFLLSSDVMMDMSSTSGLTQSDNIGKIKNFIFIVKAE